MLTLLTLALVAPPAARTFDLTYSAKITGLTPGVAVRVWVPVPADTQEQSATLTESAGKLTREPKSGNRMLYLEPTADASGAVTVGWKATVTRRAAVPRPAGDIPAARFLQPDALVPVAGKPLALLVGKPLPNEPREKARALYDLVFDYMKYGKDVAGWGRGDAVWACDSRTGNCSDFHSLFISLCRGSGLPARFEIGFGLPVGKGAGKIAGYHCWASVLAGGEWLPADISEPQKLGRDRADYFGRLPPNRVTLSAGRDLTLEPKQAGPPLNFFVYPYAEAGGKPVPADRVKPTVTFADR